jgi:hypothetical protein
MSIADTGRFWENTGYTSIADTGRFWEILVIPVLQIPDKSSPGLWPGELKNNIQVHSATSYLIFQYLQYWYNQYFPESSSICNTGNEVGEMRKGVGE